MKQLLTSSSHILGGSRQVFSNVSLSVSLKFVQICREGGFKFLANLQVSQNSCCLGSRASHSIPKSLARLSKKVNGLLFCLILAPKFFSQVAKRKIIDEQFLAALNERTAPPGKSFADSGFGSAE